MKLKLAIIPLFFTPFLYGQASSYDYDPAKLYPPDSLKADLRFLHEDQLFDLHKNISDRESGQYRSWPDAGIFGQA
jgi:hypothetical protein